MSFADETPSKRSKTVMARRYYNSFGWTRHELLEDGTRVTVPPFSFAYPTDTKLGTGVFLVLFFLSFFLTLLSCADILPLERFDCDSSFRRSRLGVGE